MSFHGGAGLGEAAHGTDPRVGQVLVAFRGHGARVPLFCFHPVGGNVLHYRALLPALHPEQPPSVATHWPVTLSKLPPPRFR